MYKQFEVRILAKYHSWDQEDIYFFILLAMDISILLFQSSKYELYEQQGVKYYLIIDADNTEVEVYQLIEEKYIRCTLTDA